MAPGLDFISRHTYEVTYKQRHFQDMQIPALAVEDLVRDGVAVKDVWRMNVNTTSVNAWRRLRQGKGGQKMA